MKQKRTEPLQANRQLKAYFCPYCQKKLMTGDVRRLSMTCPNCYKMIDADEKDLLENNPEDEVRDSAGHGAEYQS